MAKEQLNFWGCLKLLEKCLKEEVLQPDPDRRNSILVYREAGADSVAFPEGWYSTNISDVAQEIMDEPEGQKVLMDALESKGAKFNVPNKYLKNKAFFR